MLKAIWEEVCWKADDVKYWAQDRGHDIACEWRGLKMAFRDAVNSISYKIDNARWEIEQTIEDFKCYFQKEAGDGSFKIAEGVYIFPPLEKPELSAAEKRAQKFADAKANAIDAEFTVIPR